MTTYRVITSGVREGYRPAFVAGKIAALFKGTMAQVEPLLRSKDTVVKRGMDAEAAAKYKQALEACGCICRIEADPVVYTEDQIATIVPHLLHRSDIVLVGTDAEVVLPLVADLVVAFHFAGTRVAITFKMLAAMQLNPDQLYQRAVDNLYVLLRPRLLFRQNGPNCFSLIETGDNLEASCLLLPPIWDSVRYLLKGPLRIAIPTKGNCFYCGADDSRSYQTMRQVARDLRDASPDRSLSDYIYTVDPAGAVQHHERYLA
jgi:hypothetical protein